MKNSGTFPIAKSRITNSREELRALACMKQLHIFLTKEILNFCIENILKSSARPDKQNEKCWICLTQTILNTLPLYYFEDFEHFNFFENLSNIRKKPCRGSIETVELYKKLKYSLQNKGRGKNYLSRAVRQWLRNQLFVSKRVVKWRPKHHE